METDNEGNITTRKPASNISSFDYSNNLTIWSYLIK